MGYDKPDLGFVIHYQSPASVVAYYQQVGRAGRAIENAHGVVLSGQEDTEISNYFIDSAFPDESEVQQIIGAILQVPQGLSEPELLARLNISKGRIERALSILALESPAPLVKVGPKWQVTAATLSGEFWKRTRRLTRLRKEEQAQMQEYIALSDGHMDFIIRALDGVPAANSRRKSRLLGTTVRAGMIQSAQVFLRRIDVPIVPRKQWPAGGLPIYDVKGNIRPEHQSEPGYALSTWGDSGWGALVRAGKYQNGEFSDELVRAAVDLIQGKFKSGSISWVTCIPSRRHPDLVPSFAKRLAKVLGLPYHGVLVIVKDHPEQKTMANSAQQARNLDGVFRIQGNVSKGSVLVVDDIVDSKWTVTVAAMLLRSNGSGQVIPLALALAYNGFE